MKKYFAAAAVAVMAFAFSAMAASLNVDGGTLQVGDDGVTCTNDAQVYAWGYNDHVSPPTVANLGLALPDHDDECTGDNINLALLDANGDVIQRVSKLAVDGPDQGRFDFDPTVVVSEIEYVRVAIETGGPGVGDWEDSPLSNSTP